MEAPRIPSLRGRYDDADASHVLVPRRVVAARALAAGGRRRVAHLGGGGQGRRCDRPAAPGLPERPPGRRRAIRARSIVLQIDTAGTLDQDGMAFAQRVADLSVPVVAWVGTAPARASGAGLLLMYASSWRGSRRGARRDRSIRSTSPVRTIGRRACTTRSRAGSRRATRTPTSTGSTGRSPPRRRVTSTSRRSRPPRSRTCWTRSTAERSRRPAVPSSCTPGSRPRRPRRTRGRSTSASRTSGRSTACCTVWPRRRWCISCSSWRSPRSRSS